MGANGMPWFRVDSGWEDHPKIQAFIAELNEPLAAIYVERLWNHTARYFPNGRIAATTASLERALKWTGAPGRLVAALLMPSPGGGPGLLEGTEGAFTPHDWEEHNGAAFRKFTSDRKRRKNPSGTRTDPERTPSATVRNETLRTKDQELPPARGDAPASAAQAEPKSAEPPDAQVQRVYSEFARLNPECCQPGRPATKAQAKAIREACDPTEGRAEAEVFQSLAGTRALWEDASPKERRRLEFLRKLEIVVRPKHVDAGLLRLNGPPPPPRETPCLTALPHTYPVGRQSILDVVEALNAQRH